MDKMFHVQWDFHLLLDKKRWVNVSLGKEMPLGGAGKSSKWTLIPEAHSWEPTWLPATSVSLGKMGGQEDRERGGQSPFTAIGKLERGEKLTQKSQVHRCCPSTFLKFRKKLVNGFFSLNTRLSFLFKSLSHSSNSHQLLTDSCYLLLLGPASKVTLKCSEKQDAEETFPWCSSKRLTPTWCHKPCSLIQPSLHFGAVPRSLGWWCNGAGAAHSCAPASSQEPCWGSCPSPSLGPTHFTDIIQDSLPFQHIHPRYWQHLLGPEYPGLLAPISPFSLGSFATFYSLQQLDVQV